jgi:ABC-type transporter Mla subunit MlaD
MQLEVGAALSTLEEQRRQVEEWVRQSRRAAEETQQQLAAQMEQQTAALDRLSGAGAAFVEMAERVKSEVKALPNPSERLAGLWDDVRSLESTLATSIGGAMEQLGALSRADELSSAIARLERSSGTAATAIETGGAQLGDALRRELAQMNHVLDEYTRLFERSLESASFR